MATNDTTPSQRIARLLSEGARILAIHPGQSGIDISYDVTALLEEATVPDRELEIADNQPAR